MRIIAATNRDLATVVQEGRLRPDLYYRLNIVSLWLPPLRQRREDIPLLARHFLAKYTAEFHKHITDFSAAALQSFMVYEWPGNVRELEHVVTRAVVLSEQAVIQDVDIVPPLFRSPGGARIVSSREGTGYRAI